MPDPRQSPSGPLAQQTGTATLVAGTVTVTGVPLTGTARIQVTRNTPGGVIGDLSAPSATRSVPLAQFVINSANVGDLSTVDWLVTL